MQRLEPKDRENVAPDEDGAVGGDQISNPINLGKWEPLKDFQI